MFREWTGWTKKELPKEAFNERGTRMSGPTRDHHKYSNIVVCMCVYVCRVTNEEEQVEEQFSSGRSKFKKAIIHSLHHLLLLLLLLVIVADNVGYFLMQFA